MAGKNPFLLYILNALKFESSVSNQLAFMLFCKTVLPKYQQWSQLLVWHSCVHSGLHKTTAIFRKMRKKLEPVKYFRTRHDIEKILLCFSISHLWEFPVFSDSFSCYWLKKKQKTQGSKNSQSYFSSFNSNEIILVNPKIHGSYKWVSYYKTVQVESNLILFSQTEFAKLDSRRKNNKSHIVGVLTPSQNVFAPSVSSSWPYCCPSRSSRPLIWESFELSLVILASLKWLWIDLFQAWRTVSSIFQVFREHISRWMYLMYMQCTACTLKRTAMTLTM